MWHNIGKKMAVKRFVGGGEVDPSIRKDEVIELTQELVRTPTQILREILVIVQRSS